VATATVADVTPVEAPVAQPEVVEVAEAQPLTETTEDAVDPSRPARRKKK
jgi:hypothetical protein